MPPSCVSIPNHVTAYVGGFMDTSGRLYNLWKGGRTITVHLPGVIPQGARISEDIALFRMSDREYWFGLEIIQTMIDTIVFGKTNYAHIVQQKNGSYRVLYRNNLIPPIETRPWTILVDESEITITSWVRADLQHGLWAGREVDIWLAWDDICAGCVNAEMRGQKYLLGLDLTFEIIAHVVRDGQVVGTLTEPAYGRMCRYSDRKLVYEAVAKVQAHGYTWHPCNCGSIMISTDGKVRLLNLALVQKIPEDADVEQIEHLAHVHHWAPLKEIFEELKLWGNFAPCTRDLVQHSKLVPEIPSIGRMLIPDTFTFIIRYFGNFPSTTNAPAKSKTNYVLKGPGYEFLKAYTESQNRLKANSSSGIRVADDDDDDEVDSFMKPEGALVLSRPYQGKARVQSTSQIETRMKRPYGRKMAKASADQAESVAHITTAPRNFIL